LNTKRGQAVLIPQNRYSEQAYRNRPALTAWRTRLVPSALALFVVQNPLEGRLPEGTKMDSDSRQWFIHANDAIGVRSRARVLGALVEKYIHNEGENNWVSLASGTRLSRCWKRCGLKLDGQQVYLTLVDKDPVALSWAETWPRRKVQRGRTADVAQAQPGEYAGAQRRLLLELGEHQAELVDALGIPPDTSTMPMRRYFCSVCYGW
jgi:hypothetical protein